MPTLRDEPEWLTKALQTGAATDTTPRPPLSPEEAEVDDKASEKAFQADVIKFAKKHGWNLIYHTFDSRKSQAGFPDLVMIRGCRLVVAELKSVKGTASPEQEEWLEGFRTVGADVPWIKVFLWRPQDWPQIVEVLT